MSIAVGLFVYAVVVAIVAPRVLPRLTRHGLVPHLGVVAWLTLMASVLGSWGAAVGIALADTAHSWLHADRLVVTGLHEAEVIVTGHAGLGAQAALLMVTGALAILGVVLGVRLTRLQLRMRLRSREHAEALRLTGRRVQRCAVADLVVLESEERAAYCVAGSPNVVVVTSGAVAALGESELAAVLAHEHAHLRRQHPLLLTVTRGLAATFPHLRLFTVGAREVARLLEMCADDAAVRRYGRAPLLSGLLALSGVAPAGALAASGADVVARAERLVAPRNPRLRRTRMGLLTGIGVAVMGPLLIVGTASGLLICLL
ncbi:M56 family metallopeptidase [Nocardia sp. NPDC051570]|uniref:M56 family metallopeptidase n=1 Tax=Nocardia sp. NPDC051570 TaxID=3364324 RepID=UPI00378A22E8